MSQVQGTTKVCSRRRQTWANQSRFFFLDSPKQLEGTDAFDEDKVSEFYTGIYTDLAIDSEENQELYSFFKEENPPPVDKLILTRATAFRIGCDFLGDDRDTNVQLFRCINVVVHALELSVFK